MAASKSMAWLVVIGAITLALVGLSFVALDKDNVVWRDGRALCPHCRTAVPAGSHRCPTCREEFDWVVPADEDSPVCAYCLSPGEDDLLRERRKALGEADAVARVAAATGLSEAGATAYLRAAGRGQCGWCGGSGRDLARADAADALCPVCFGAKHCVFCGGDRRVRVGVEAAARDVSRYRGFVDGLAGDLSSPAATRKEVAGWNEAFLKAHTGEEEAADLLFPESFRPLRPGAGPPPADLSPDDNRRSSTAARRRASDVVTALSK